MQIQCGAFFLAIVPDHTAGEPRGAGRSQQLEWNMGPGSKMRQQGPTMKTFLVRTLGVVVFLATIGAAQDVIPLPTSAGPNSTQESYPEREYFSKIWNTEVVAKYVAAKGVTAFVLKYRLAHTGEDATQEFNEMLKDGQKLRDMLGKVIPQSNA